MNFNWKHLLILHPCRISENFDADNINDINERIVQKQQETSSDNRSKNDPPNQDGGTSSSGGSSGTKGNQENKKYHQGKLLLDATCAPADIAYPTDVGLLNKAREKLEGMIDTLHAPFIGNRRKPRTYRKKARKQYLSLSKQRKPGKGKIRKATQQQLNYVQRNLKHVMKLGKRRLHTLSNRQYRDFLVIQELYRQQKMMFETDSKSIYDRIVSINQPQVSPIVRGKANARTEFGAKISVSVINGYAFLDTLSWDSYHEGKLLKESVEKYKERYGYYPKAVLADTIYRTRENIAYCKGIGIRLSGPKLGRPSKDEQINMEQKRIEKQDVSERNAIEGKFGEGKRRYGLGLISARLHQTSETAISLSLLLMNIGKVLRDTFLIFLFLFYFSYSKEEKIVLNI